MNSMRQFIIVLLTVVTVFASPVQAQDDENPQVKKSNSDICHQIGTTSYERTKNFTPYPSMEACIESGGRKPKK